MKLGLDIYPTDRTPPPGEVARLAEERGFESLLFPEHTHIPGGREAMARGGSELRALSRMLDPFVACTAAAATTQRLRVGTGICLLVQRDPIITAKAVASLDVVSTGRVLFGIGAGWNREEMIDHGTDPRRRFRVMRERIEAMKRIWMEDEPEYHGEHVDFDPIWSWPKPVQQPHPPILVGGGGERVIDRVIAYGDEWIPNRVPSMEALRERTRELRERAGRHVPVSFFGAKPEAETVERLQWAGVDRCIYYVDPEADAGEVERALDGFAAFR